MGIFRKKSSTHFERDSRGRVVSVVRSGDKVSRTPVTDALMEKYYDKHPEKRTSAKLKRGAVKFGRKLDEWSRNYSKSQGKRGPMFTWNPPRSSGRGRDPLALELFNFGGMKSNIGKKPSPSGKKYHIKGGVAYPIAKKRTGKKTSGKKRRKYNPDDPFDFPDMGW